MSGNPSALFRPLVLVLAFAGVLFVPAHAQSSGEVANGLEAGPWILAPYVVTGYESDDNIFRRSASADPLEDRIATFTLGASAYLPFRNSMLSIDYQVSQLQYEDNNFDRDTNHDATVELAFVFSSYDRLTLRDTYSRSFSNLQNADTGGELVFNGQPYNFNRWDIELSRQIPNRAGYTARITRSDLNYQGEDDVPFFDSRGFEFVGEYRQPIAGRRSLLVYAQRRRFDNFDANSPDTVGVAFRKEISNQYLVGLQGLLGKDQSYLIRIGVGDFRYDLVDSTNYSGFVGTAQWVIPFGGRSSAQLSLQRSSLPSNFDTYYVNNEFRATFERKLGRVATGGMRLLGSRNSYGDAIAVTGCETFKRSDERIQLQPYLEFMVHPRLAFQVQGTHEDRTSNCEAVEYKYTSVNVGLTFGWF